MAAPADDARELSRRHAWLMDRALGRKNDDVLAQMIASASLARAFLPSSLGLEAEAFRALLRFHFPGVAEAVVPDGSRSAPLPDRDACDGVSAEIADLRELLLSHRAHGSDESPSETWIAEIVARACLGREHLWRDLGLRSRDSLSVMLADNFPGLVERNVDDMKWKKFLYKQLCELQGTYVCRAPSCEYCGSYLDCFGPED